MSNIAKMKLDQKLSDLYIIDFIELIHASRICVNFSARPLGSASNLTIKGVQFQLLAEGEIVNTKVGNDPNLRKYLQITDNAIRIELPHPASRIDVFVGGIGAGGQIIGLILDQNGNLMDKWTEGSEHVIHTHTTFGTDLKTILITTTSDAEGLIWGVCYVP